MKKAFIFLQCILITGSTYAQNVGIGTTSPAASAKLEINSNSKGFLMPRMTEGERNNMTNPADGLLIFNLTTGTINFYFNGIWNEFAAIPLGAIGSLKCASSVSQGTNITQGLPVPDSTTVLVVPYTGGNGGTHSGQTVSSNGVTGLTATLGAGSFKKAGGDLIYWITGTPTGSGTARFGLNIGGKTCTVTQIVYSAGSIANLNCAGSSNSGTLTNGLSASGVISTINYTGGNGGTYTNQTIASTGVTGLTASLEEGIFTNGGGNLTFYINGKPASSGTASFALNIGGKACTLTRVVHDLGTISTLNCGGATNTGTLTGTMAATNVTSTVPYTGGNNGTYKGDNFYSTGVTGLTATLAPGFFANGNGTLTFTITGTPNVGGTASFELNIGGKNCTLTRTVNVPAGSVATLNCSGSTPTGRLTEGWVAGGVSSRVSYSGGNGGTHNGQTVNSTGVTGLTATLPAGQFGVGSGNLIFTITGTPASGGTASFGLNVGGQTCTLTRTVDPIPTYAAGTVHCDPASPTLVQDVVLPSGKIWMDRNLGASQAATSSTDAASFGDLYQWGRRADGHQCRNSTTTAVLSSIDQPAHGNFILSPNQPNDWRNPQNSNLWQGVNGINNPCPSGYRLPTFIEWNEEIRSWSSENSVGAFDSPLKLPTAVDRRGNDGFINTGNSFGSYWSSSISTQYSTAYRITNSSASGLNIGRANGSSVRCIRE